MSNVPADPSLALVFPGQGSQSVGMLAALAAEFPVVQTTFAEASAVLGYDLWDLVQQGPKELLDETERTQPAMLAAGVATWRAWCAAGGAMPSRMAMGVPSFQDASGWMSIGRPPSAAQSRRASSSSASFFEIQIWRRSPRAHRSRMTLAT